MGICTRDGETKDALDEKRQLIAESSDRLLGSFGPSDAPVCTQEANEHAYRNKKQKEARSKAYCG